MLFIFLRLKKKLLGFKDHLRKMLAAENNPVTAIRKEIFLAHTLALDMGMKFKELIQ
jgi:hypothetical protein